jgi:transposase-like protein
MSKRGKRRTARSASEKMRIVLKGMETDIDVAALCRQEGSNPTQYYTWKRQLVAGADAVFGGKRIHVSPGFGVGAIRIKSGDSDP